MSDFYKVKKLHWESTDLLSEKAAYVKAMNLTNTYPTAKVQYTDKDMFMFADNDRSWERWKVKITFTNKEDEAAFILKESI